MSKSGIFPPPHSAINIRDLTKKTKRNEKELKIDKRRNKEITEMCDDSGMRREICIFHHNIKLGYNTAKQKKEGKRKERETGE
jgi:hypothetical protein